MAVTRWSRRAHFADPALEDNSRADASRRLELLLDKLALNAGADERIDPLIRPYAWSTSSLVEKLSWRVAGSPARRLFSAAHYRRFRDLDHPRVLAFGEYLRGSEYRAVALVADE